MGNMDTQLQCVPGDGYPKIKFKGATFTPWLPRGNPQEIAGLIKGSLRDHGGYLFLWGLGVALGGYHDIILRTLPKP